MEFEQLLKKKNDAKFEFIVKKCIIIAFTWKTWMCSFFRTKTVQIKRIEALFSVVLLEARRLQNASMDKKNVQLRYLKVMRFKTGARLKWTCSYAFRNGSSDEVKGIPWFLTVRWCSSNRFELPLLWWFDDPNVLEIDPFPSSNINFKLINRYRNRSIFNFRIQHNEI